MIRHSTRSCVLFAFIAFLSIMGCRSSGPGASSQPKKKTAAVVSPATTSPPTCTGKGAGTATHDSTEAALASLINSYRTSQTPPLTAGVAVGGDVAASKWHAADMAAEKYVGLVGSDGQDIFMRVRCSAASSWGGTAQAIAIRGSSDPNKVFEALKANPSADAALKRTPGSQISIGQSNGYWMIFII